MDHFWGQSRVLFLTSRYYVQDIRSKTKRLSTLEKGGLLDMARGRVKWYSPQLGYGFILPDDGGVEL